MRRRDFLSLTGVALALALGGCISAPKKKPVQEGAVVPDASGAKIESVATNLEVPWDIDFSKDGRIFFTERVGRIRVIDGELLPEPFATLPVTPRGEGGVLGLALHPSFPRKPFVYVYYTYSDNRGLLNRVSRFTAEGSRAVKEEIIIDGIPGGAIHNGGRLSFGPEGYLYITTGDAGDSSTAQDLNSRGGKFLRLTDEGSVPEDNPFGSAVYSYGHRNPQGLDWAPSGNLIATEHGPRAHDEINLIIKGRNYGWPEVKGIASKEGFTDPLLESGLDTWAPSGAAFYRGSYFFAALRGRHLHKIVFNDDFTEVKNHEKLFEGTYGRLRHVAQNPGGELYLLTSNRDGRGNPAPNDDRILKLVP